jgi:hypothetical protein
MCAGFQTVGFSSLDAKLAQLAQLAHSCSHGLPPGPTMAPECEAREAPSMPPM